VSEQRTSKTPFQDELVKCSPSAPVTLRHTGELRSFQISECQLCNGDAHPLLC
ncbi:hypothetical protein KUCAC02_028987, partial [Chaenocephalus aceratus]